MTISHIVEISANKCCGLYYQITWENEKEQENTGLSH